ncbi:hypothetical protein [Streptomyces sp. NPDC058664]|uniref:hypothetical protein n=1 Tax=unclassified Streptomyces TaxID=2593676 RepID=UPI003647E0AE
MTDGIAWLAVPRSIAYGGYSVVLARGLDAGELATRLAGAVYGPPRTVLPLGELTAGELIEALEGEDGDYPEEAALRLFEDGEWVVAVMYGLWQGEFEVLTPVSRGGAHVFHLEFEEENGKPVPPYFGYFHDGRVMCFFNLHLDYSWGYDGVSGEPEVARPVQELLTAAGLPGENLPMRGAHRISLEVLERHFGLSLPRTRILDEALPAVVLETA